MLNAKVMNYELRNLEINKLSGWNLAPLRKLTGQFMVVKYISNWHMHY